MKKQQLRQQLQKAGADRKEASDLMRLASQLSNAPSPHLSKRTREKILGIPGLPEERKALVWGLSSSFAVVILLVVIAQSALPGSWLYGVKRGSEQMRTLVQPSYTDTLVEKRKEEVEVLKQEAAKPEQVERAEDAYHKALEKSLERKQRGNNGTIDPKNKDVNDWNWRNNNRDDGRRQNRTNRR